MAEERERRRLQTTIDKQLYKKTRIRAIELEVNANDVLEKALEEYLEKNPIKEDFHECK